MGADEITAEIGLGLGSAYLRLTAGDAELLLQDPLLGNTPETTTSIADAPAAGIDDAASLIDTSWVVVKHERDGATMFVPEEPLTISFRPEFLSSQDGCNGATATVSYSGSTLVVVGDAVHTLVACAGRTRGDVEAASEIEAAFLDESFAPGVPISVDIDSDVLRLTRGTDVITLRPE